jgi:hypothetical protein
MCSSPLTKTPFVSTMGTESTRKDRNMDNSISASDRVLYALSGADPASALLAIRLWLASLPDGCRQGTIVDLAGVCQHPDVQ